MLFYQIQKFLNTVFRPYAEVLSLNLLNCWPVGEVCCPDKETGAVVAPYVSAVVSLLLENEVDYFPDTCNYF